MYIDTIKKYATKGSKITIYTEDKIYEGNIVDFEDAALMIDTGEALELLTDECIKRFTLSKDKVELVNVSNVIVPNKSENTQFINNKTETLQPEKITEVNSSEKAEPPILYPSKGNKKLTTVFKDPSELTKLIMPQIEEENKLIVPARGVIIKNIAESRSGIIKDEKGKEIWFSQYDTIDNSIIQALTISGKRVNIPVIFNINKNSYVEKAILVSKPRTVESLIENAKNFEKDGKIKDALGIIEIIIYSFPDNITANRYHEELTKKINKTELRRNVGKKKYLYYQEAVRLKNIEKNNAKALEYYKLALKNNENKESCIKDIGMLLVTMDKREEAIKFINSYVNQLTANLSTFFYLENLYFSLAEYTSAIKYLDKILEDKLINRDKQKYSYYLAKKGYAFIKQDKIEIAKEILNEAILIYPQSTFATKLLQALEETNSAKSKIEIDFTEFARFGGGLSKFINETVENYEAYYGVPAKIIDNNDFNSETLNSIRRLIETAGRARPRERAGYLLTEAKLITILEPEKTNELRSVLARYCNAMALNHIYENTHMDVIRSFYLEAFSLQEEYKPTAQQVAIYLLTYKENYAELNTNLEASVDNALQIIFKGEIKEYIWEGILSMFLCNREISARIIAKLFANKIYREKSFSFFSSIGLNINNIETIEDYKDLWNKTREQRQRDYEKWFALLKAIENNNDLASLIEQLIDSSDDIKKNWMLQLDILRFNIITKDIAEIILQYLNQTTFRDKERSHNISQVQIKQLIEEIKDKPTKCSYEGFIPLLEKIQLLLDKSFSIILKASEPKVKIIMLNENCVVNEDYTVKFPIQIENSKDSSPISNIKIIIINNEDIEFIEKNNVYHNSLDGDNYLVFSLTVRINDKVLNDKAATLDILCSYSTRDKELPSQIESKVTLRLYSEKEFVKFENPYAPLADGGPVEDSKMFYGRNEFIQNRVESILSADTKQIIIYGQKRSGKTSVLHHLKKSLEETNKTFCVSFSLGEIISNLNEFTFYYHILSRLSRNLRQKKLNNETVPNFNLISLDEFFDKYKHNPATGFLDIMSDFKEECLKIEEWKSKKIIIMIDEFTYLYTSIKNGKTSDTIMKQWKAITQNDFVKLSVVLVGQDTVPIFKNEPYAKNAFGVIEDIRLTYLNVEDAKRLIIEPILDNENKSRFIGKAVDVILEYTSCNPYYIQIFCSRLVEHMNMQKLIKVTEADVKEVADTFIEGNTALAPEKFDNLIRAGEEYDYKEFYDQDVIKILRQIALNSKNIGFCARDNISLNNPDLENKILDNLVSREVLELKQGNNFKIQVRLFQEWLLRH